MKRWMVKLFVCASVYLLCSSSHCYATPIYLSSQQTAMLEENLLALQDNNDRLSVILDKQSEELTRLQMVSERQSKMLKSSQSDLVQSKASLTLAKTSLETAQKELDGALQSLEKQEKKALRIKRQRNFWSVVAGSLAVGLAISFAS